MPEYQESGSITMEDGLLNHQSCLF